MANELTVEINADDSGLQEGLSNIKKGLSTAATAAAAAGAAIAMGLGLAIIKTTSDFESGISKFRQQTGVTAKEMNGLGGAIKDLYSKGFGESMTDISSAMAVVKQQSKVLNIATTKDIKEMTKNALTLAETFEFDVSETVKASSSMIQAFGIKGNDAMNLIAKGAQLGLNKSDDLIDTLNEYSPHFAMIGMSATDMFRILKNGSESGALSVDKVGDAIKEFGIRSKDASTTSKDAFTNLGLNANTMFQTFASGGDKAKTAFNTVIEKLNGIKDPVKQNEIGVALFGSMFEDLGAKAILNMGKVDNSFKNSKNTLAEINKIKMSEITSQLTVFKRELEANILIPLGESLLPKLKQWTSKLDDVKLGLQMAGVIKTSKKDMETWGESASDTAKNTEKLAKAIKTVVKAMEKVIEIATLIPTKLGLIDEKVRNSKALSGEIPFIGDSANKFIDDLLSLDKISNSLDWWGTGEKSSKGFSNGFNSGITTSKEGVKANISSMADVTSLNKSAETYTFGKGNADSFNSGIKSVKPSIINSVSDVSNMMGLNKSGQTYTFGKGNTDSYSSGLNSSKAKVSSSITNISNMMGLNKGNETHTFGKNISTSYGSGISSGKGNVTSASNNIIDGLNSMKRIDSETWGSKLINQLVSGIRAGIGKVKSVCKDVGDAIARFFPHSPAKEGALRTFPDTGYTLMEQLMQGIEGSQSKLDAITANVASSINGNINTNVAMNSNNQQQGITVPIYLDGKMISKVTAPYMVRALRNKGF